MSFPTLPGLAGRWNALNVTTSGGNVTSATDLSGNGNNLTNTGNVPLASTGYNGHPCFSFLAANTAALSASGIPMGTGNAGYFFFVGQMLTGTTSSGGAIVYGASGQTDFFGTNSDAVFTRNGGANSLDSRGGVTNPGSLAISLATNYRVGVNLNQIGDGTSSFYLNNVQSSGPTVVGNWATGGTIVIGARFSSGSVDTSQSWEGPICEIVVGNAALSSTDINNLDAYFTAQWGT